MSEERAADTTRAVLRSFGVMVTTYQERMAQLLEEAGRENLAAEEALQLVASALTLSARLTRRLREVSELVLALEERSLAQLQERLVQRFPSVRLEPEE
ncbi:MAG: hypothetical protein RMK01_01600 [Thermomicrobium sp.]|nr:hypothetical protein [Thermomicrobium sp.]